MAEHLASSERPGPWGGDNRNKPVDARLSLFYRLVAAGDHAAYRRMLGAGAVRQEDGVEVLTIPLQLRLTAEQVKQRAVDQEKLRVRIPAIYFRRDAVGLPNVSGRIEVRIARADTAAALEEHLRMLIGAFECVGLPGLVYSSLEDSLVDINPPSQWKYESVSLDGTGVVIGIIDDGCGFAHRHFITRRPKSFRSRIRYLWDQTARTSAPSADWQIPADFGYGYELENVRSRRHIDAALNGNVQSGVIDEDKVYASLGYGPRDSHGGMPSHGTHVMDVAAGNGTTFAGRRGVAPAADIVFVQLPRSAVEEPTAGLLENFIEEGVKYIVERARTLRRPVVINISYGGYGGPHDGTSQLEKCIDAELGSSVRNRAVVVSAGNGFEGDCHAQRAVAPGSAQIATLRWIVHPDDPTDNRMEIWYPGGADLTVTVAHPRAASPAVALDQEAEIAFTVPVIGSASVGSVQHWRSATGNGDNHALIFLRAGGADDATSSPIRHPAPPGVWEVRIENRGLAPVRVDAWIEHDRSARWQITRYQQSRFHVDDSDPTSTLGSLSTGRKSIVVGGYNTSSQAVARYSACGPTRPTGLDTTGRRKPEVCAPAATDPRGRGVLSAEVMSGLPRRMNGTSIAAPHVAGLVALVLQFARSRGCRLNVDELRDIVTGGANSTTLVPDAAHEQSPQPIKQSAVFAHLIGAGKADLHESLKLAKAKCP